MATQQPARPTAQAVKPQAAKPQSANPQNADIMVVETGSTERIHWDCANLFAEGRVDEIQRYVEQALKQKQIGAYEMLFGALRLKGDKETFETIALEYTVDSGQSPPNWLEIKTEERTKTEVETLPVTSMSAADAMSLVIRLENPEPLCLSFASVQKADPKGIEQINQAITERISRGDKLSVSQESGFITTMLQRAKAAGKNQAVIPLWNFIFNLYRLTGRYEDFDREGGDFIEMFGEEQQWRDLSGKSKASQSTDPAEVDTAIYMPAKLAPPYENLIKKCVDAENDDEVVIDLSMVKMTNMAAVKVMVEVLKVATSNWKTRVHLRNTNEIVAAMFRIFGGDKHMRISFPGSNS